VSVCVLVLTDPTLALDCLDSLAAASVDYAVETIVVANGTSEEALSVLQSRDDIVLVRSGTNLGFAGGNNLAADLARGRFLLLINDDSTVEEGFVNRLVATAEADPTIGAVGGRILAADGSLQEAGSVLWRDGWATHVGLGLGPDTRAFDYVRDTDYVSANGMLVRRTAWDAVGGLDERYFPAYYEDVDLCLALHRREFRVVYEPRARLRHLESQSTPRRYRDFLLVRNRRLLVEKWTTDLEHLDDRPSVIDEVAIERSIHRARGQPPRLLVVAEGAGGSGADLWEVAARLASEGWAVTVSSADPDSDPDRSTRADRMADLGVDVCGEAVAATTALVFDAVLVGTEFAGRPPRLVRPDGRDTPVVRASPEEGEVGVRATASAVAGNLA
jgi:GT2 family glycosyltransferase